MTGRVWKEDFIVLYFALGLGLLATWELGMALLVLWILLTATPRGRE